MHGDEVCALNQVSASYRLRAETKVGHSHCARLLRVINKVALCVIRGLFTDDFDRVLVSADRAIGAQSPEECAHLSGGFDIEGGITIQAVESDVVRNADAEMVLRITFRQFIKDTLDHRRREFFRAQTIAAADDARRSVRSPTVREGHWREEPLVCTPRAMRARGPRLTRGLLIRFTDCGHHILIERLARAPWFLRPIQNCDCFHRRRQRRDEMIYRERPEETDL